SPTSSTSTSGSKRGKRMAAFSRFLSLSSGRIDFGVGSPNKKDRQSGGSLRSDSTPSRLSTTTASLTSLSRRRDYPLPWLEALFLPSFPNRGNLSEKSFQFYDEIGRGTFSVVRRAQFRSTHNRRFCAIKIQDKASIMRHNYVSRANEEVLILQQLPFHPFIIEFMGSWQSRTHLYACLELPTGDGCSDLARITRQYGTMNEAALRVVFVQLACALDFLHRNAIIYRDMKAENVLVDRRGHVRLIDFGMAKMLSQGDRTKSVCGSLQYMAPEIATEWPEGYDHSVDWWSLAVLGHLLLTGRFPYPNSLATHHSHLIFIDYSTPPGRSADVSQLFDRMLRSRMELRLYDFDSFKALPFFASINWELVESGKYSLVPHLERANRIASRRKRLRLSDAINEDGDEDIAEFSERYEAGFGTFK
ncbi:hypothetical protein PFISCL1PPCAC_9702, partial [Pristionchus fissidentatus]